MKKLLASALFLGTMVSAYGQIYVAPPVYIVPQVPVCVYPENGGEYFLDSTYGAYYFVCGGVIYWMPLGWDWRRDGFYHGPYVGNGRGRFNGERYGEGRYHYEGHGHEHR